MGRATPERPKSTNSCEERGLARFLLVSLLTLASRQPKAAVVPLGIGICGGVEAVTHSLDAIDALRHRCARTC